MLKMFLKLLKIIFYDHKNCDAWYNNHGINICQLCTFVSCNFFLQLSLVFMSDDAFHLEGMKNWKP